MINGTSCVILKNGVEVVGQMESSVNYGGELVRIDNPSLDKWVEYLDKKLSARSIEISGSIVYNNSIVYESIKHDAYNGLVDTYTFMFAETGERINGLFMPTGMSDAVPHGDKVTTAIIFKSSEEVGRTPQSKYTEIGQLTASDAQSGDRFGSSVSVYGDRLVVGAYFEDTAGTNAGKVYIYDWNGTEYTEIGQLTASDAQANDQYGVSVSVYGDRLVVGAHVEDTAGSEAGKVYIYDWNGNSYTEIGQLTASDAQLNGRFGASVSVYMDRLIVGAYPDDTAATDAGKVYYYDWNGTEYTEIGQLTASDAQAYDFYGISVSVYEGRLVVGAYSEDTAGSDAGKVYIYDWNGNSYTEIGQLTASDAQLNGRFGASVSVYMDRLVVGAYLQSAAVTSAGKAYYYDWNGTDYIEIGQLTASDAQVNDLFGFSVSVYGNRLVVGAMLEDTAATDAGKVYYYDDIK